MLAIVLAFLTFVCVSSTLATLLALSQGVLTQPIAFISLAGGTLAASSAFHHGASSLSPQSMKPARFGLWTWLTLVLFALFSLKNILWLFFTKQNELCVSSPNNLGDMMLHSCYTHYFANQPSFWPQNPIIANQPILYPFGMDLFNGLLMLAGLDFFQGLVWVGLFGCLAAGYMLYRWGRTFTLAGFMMNGGLAGFIFFQDFQIPNQQFALLSWKNLALTLLITQRNFLFVLPAGLLLLCAWRERTPWSDPSTGKFSRALIPAWLEILLLATMPLFHVHTFVFLSLLLLFWFCFLPDQRIRILCRHLPALLLAIPFLVLVSNGFKATSFVHLRWGWEQPDNQNPVYYWINNFGIFLPLCLWLFLKHTLEIRGKSIIFQWRLNAKTAWIFPALLLFALFSNLMLTPWNWDNIKLLLWAYLILLPFIWQDLIRPCAGFFRVIILIVFFFTGFLWLIGDLSSRSGYPLLNRSDIQQIDFVLNKIPIQERFACAPVHNHPLLFCGRKVALGYAPWSVSHGLSIIDVEWKLRDLMKGNSSWRVLAGDLNTRYLFWGPLEEKAYPDSSRPWEQQCSIVNKGPWGTIYDLSSKKN